MDSQLYKEILDDLGAIGGLSENDKFFTFLSRKYQSVPEETLRSIIGLWYQRKVSRIASETKEVEIYKLYKKLRAAGVNEACQRIARQLNYPASLIAKIVLTDHVKEVKDEKNKNRQQEAKNLRKNQCSGNKSSNTANAKIMLEPKSIIETVSSIKRHDDHRVELALNLFGENDVIGKHILDKFKFNSGKPGANRLFGGSSRNKYGKFLQTSEFVEMGEKNVMKYTDVQKLFANRFGGKIEEPMNSSPLNVTTDLMLSDNIEITNQLNDLSLETVDSGKSMINHCSLVSESSISEGNGTDNSKLADYGRSRRNLNDSTFTDSISSRDVSLISDSSFSESVTSDVKPSKIGVDVCSPSSDSEDTDTDSDDSDDPYEYYSSKELLESTSLIEDPVLAADVFMCTLSDDQYGPTSDIIANSSGVTYEKVLEAFVKDVGIPYKTENKLRGVGVDKTPDIILLVPVAVDDFAINWIESKALFADLLLHQEFKKNQFKTYINRFGPGLVLYWHGYTDDLPEFSLLNKQIIVRDRFPPKESFKFMDSNKFRLWMQSNNSSDS